MAKRYEMYQDNLIRRNGKVDWMASIDNHSNIYYKSLKNGEIYSVSVFKKHEEDRHKIYVFYNNKVFLTQKQNLFNGYVCSIIENEEILNKKKYDNKKEGMYCVYCHVNTINNKIYIGITSNNPYKRWGSNGLRYREQIFGRAIKKYGWDNFKHLVLMENLPRDVAELVEIELIKKYDSTNSKYGYNVSTGGQTVSEETKEKLRKKLSGRKLTPEWNAKIRKAQTGLKRSKETKERIRNAVSVSVICLNNRKIYKSLTEASKINNISLGHISACCNKKRIHAGTDENGNGLLWMFYSEYLKLECDKKTTEEILSLYSFNVVNKKHIPIRNKTSNKIYKSVPLASKDTGISIGKIRSDLLYFCTDWEYIISSNEDAAYA